MARLTFINIKYKPGFNDIHPYVYVRSTREEMIMMQLTELQKQPYENEVALRTQASFNSRFLGCHKTYIFTS